MADNNDGHGGIVIKVVYTVLFIGLLIVHVIFNFLENDWNSFQIRQCIHIHHVQTR